MHEFRTCVGKLKILFEVIKTLLYAAVSHDLLIQIQETLLAHNKKQ